MNSHDDDALWSAYLDGTLDAEARAHAEARLRASAADRETLEAMRAADARLRAAAVPDPGPAYWRDFGARVESRCHPAAESPSDPARIYEKLVGWLVLGGRVRWMRAAGALAGLTLVTYIGMRGFRPSDVQIPPSPAPRADANVPPRDDVVQEAETSRELPAREPAATVAPLAKSEPKPEPDDAVPRHEGPAVGSAENLAKSDGDALHSQPSPGTSIPAESRPFQSVTELFELKKAPATDAIEPQPGAVPEPAVVFEVDPKPVARDAPAWNVRGGRSNEVRVPSPGGDPTKSPLDDRAANVGLRSEIDSLVTFLAHALRDDPLHQPEGVAGRSGWKNANQVKELASGPAGAPRAPATAEVDRLLRLADIAQRYETDAAIRPHLETIAIRLAQHARQDPRAATRARALMRTLADGSTTAGERATWEERRRQLPP